MSRLANLFAALALLTVIPTGSALARSAGSHINDAKFYGPVYGWRYSPPPAQAAEPVCTWATVRAVRNGHSVTRRVRNCH